MISVERLPTSSPSAQGVNSVAVLDFIDAVEAHPAVELHSLMVLRHGHVVAGGWWAPYTSHGLHLYYSLSKSFASTAALLAAEDGLLRFDDTVISYFPELGSLVTDPRSRSMLVRHIASMASGHGGETLERVVAAGADEPVGTFLALPPEHDPGTFFAYNQLCTYTLAAIVQRVTGESLTGYLRRRLFDALGVGDVVWLQDRVGREIGFSGMYSTTETAARLGQLYLGRGRWGGAQLLSEASVAEATRPHVATAPWPREPGAPPRSDWEQGYGFQFWMSRHGYRGDGAYGQFCLVLPEQDAVVAMTSQAQDTQALLDAVWDKLLPAFVGPGAAGPGAAGTDADADAQLEKRLESLELPAPKLLPDPPGEPSRWAAASFAPAGGRCAAHALLTGVKVRRAEDGRAGDGRAENGWRVDLVEGAEALTVELGTGRWASGLGSAPPCASAGGWEDEGTLRVHVIFLETPHRLIVTCRPQDMTFEAEWVTEPLHSRKFSLMRAHQSEEPS